RQTTLRALNANDACISGAWRFDRIRLDHVIILLPYPSLAADVRARKQAFQLLSQIVLLPQAEVVRHISRHRWFPSFHRTLVDGRIVGESFIGNLGNYLPMLQHAHLAMVGYAANLGGIEAPFFENLENFVLPTLLGNQQHPFLRLAQHDLVRSHAGFALRNAVEFNLDADVAASAHLAGRAGQPGCAHALNAHNGTGLHGFEAGLEQKLFQERITDLDVGALRFRGFAEFLAGHGGAVNPVTTGLGADVDDRITLTSGACIKNLVSLYQSERERVDQRIS